MAYLEFPDLGGIAAARRSADVAPAAADDGRLSALEWSVVMIARGDPLSSLRRPGRLAVALGVMSDRGNPGLADPRLEALRRAAVLAWHAGGTLPETEVRLLLSAGFTRRHYDALIASIVAAIAAAPVRARGVAGSSRKLKSWRSQGLRGRA